MLDGHVHIERGNYDIDWIDRFVSHAVDRGMTEIRIVEHTHRFKEFRGLYEGVAENNSFQRDWLKNKAKISLWDYQELIHKVSKQKYPISIKFGLEVCYMEDREDVLLEGLANFQGDFLIGSVHHIDNWAFDLSKELWEGKDIDTLYYKYYEIMKNLIKSQLFDSLAHPDSIKCFGHYPSFDLTETYYDIADLLNKHNMSTEQSAGLYINYGHKELGMNKTLLNIFKDKNVKLNTVSDAHRPEDVGRYIKELQI